jgi:hypothetical protein
VDMREKCDESWYSDHLIFKSSGGENIPAGRWLVWKHEGQLDQTASLDVQYECGPFTDNLDC